MSIKYYSDRQAYENKVVIKGLMTFLGILLICGLFSGDVGFLIILLILAASGLLIGSMCPDKEAMMNLAKATPIVTIIIALLTGTGIGAVIGGTLGGIFGLFIGKGLSEQKFYDRQLNNFK